MTFAGMSMSNDIPRVYRDMNSLLDDNVIGDRKMVLQEKISIHIKSF